MADNTIEALRVLQAGVEAVKAQGTLTMATQPTAGDTMTIGTNVYTFRAVADADASGEISIGTNLATAKTAFLAAMAGTDGWNDPNPLVTFSAFSGDVTTITARVPGPSGNSIVLSETFTAVDNVFNTTNPGVLGVTTAGSHARGTPVAATTRLAVEQLEWSADDENLYHPQVANGILMRYTEAGTPVQHGTRFSLAQQAAIWEQLPLWFSMMLGAPVITGSLGGPYTMTWTVSPGTNPNPYAVTLERQFDNGLGDEIAENAAYCMLMDLGLSFAANEELKLTGGAGFARKFATMGGGITAALTLPDFEVMVSALSSIYFDTLWSDVGDTLVAESVIGWDWVFHSGIFPRPTAEGRTDLSFTKHQINGRERGIDATITCLLDPDIYAQEVTRSATPATNQFAMRIKVTGSDSRQLLIDQMVQHEKPLWAPTVDQGQDVVSFSLLDCTDGTNALRIALTLPSLPELA